MTQLQGRVKGSGCVPPPSQPWPCCSSVSQRARLYDLLPGPRALPFHLFFFALPSAAAPGGAGLGILSVGTQRATLLSNCHCALGLVAPGPSLGRSDYAPGLVTADCQVLVVSHAAQRHPARHPRVPREQDSPASPVCFPWFQFPSPGDPSQGPEH